MTFKMLLMRWFWSALGVTVLALTFVAIVEHGDTLAELTAPAYLPLSDEEVFKRAGVECVHPPGARTGCVYPEIAEYEETGNYLRDYHQKALAKSDRIDLSLKMSGPESSNRSEYYEREVRPRHERLTRWTGIGLAILCLLIVVSALASTRAWWNTRAPLDVDIKWKKILPGALGRGMRDAAASRKLRRIETDFQALKSLRDNGLISDAVFEERKNVLRSSIDAR